MSEEEGGVWSLFPDTRRTSSYGRRRGADGPNSDLSEFDGLVNQEPSNPPRVRFARSVSFRTALSPGLQGRIAQNEADDDEASGFTYAYTYSSPVRRLRRLGSGSRAQGYERQDDPAFWGSPARSPASGTPEFTPVGSRDVTPNRELPIQRQRSGGSFSRVYPSLADGVSRAPSESRPNGSSSRPGSRIGSFSARPAAPLASAVTGSSVVISVDNPLLHRELEQQDSRQDKERRRARKDGFLSVLCCGAAPCCRLVSCLLVLALILAATITVPILVVNHMGSSQVPSPPPAAPPPGVDVNGGTATALTACGGHPCPSPPPPNSPPPVDFPPPPAPPPKPLPKPPAAPSPPPTPAPEPIKVKVAANIPAGTPPPPLKLEGYRLLDAESGREVHMQGVNWPGFDSGDFVIGDYSTADPAISDFSANVYQLQLLGFNAVRLTWEARTLDPQVVPESLKGQCPPKTDKQLAQRCNIGQVRDNAKIPPRPFPRPGSDNRTCNGYVPTTSLMERFFWTVKYLVHSGFYVVLSYNPGPEDASHMAMPSSFSIMWANMWAMLMSLDSYKDSLAGRVLVDLLNTPDAQGLGWDAGGLRGQNPGMAGLGDYYIAAMDALYFIDPASVLFVIEGGGQSPLGQVGFPDYQVRYNVQPGDGFVTDKQLIKDNGLADPNPFFVALMEREYLNRVIIGPSMYPPSVTGDPTTGQYMWVRFINSWSYLQVEGYCLNKKCHVFPIVPMGIGSKYSQSAVQDFTYMNQLQVFFNTGGTAMGNKVNRMASWFWWAWPPSGSASLPVGGLVTEDWASIDWNKVALLQGVGLVPYFARLFQ